MKVGKSLKRMTETFTRGYRVTEKDFAIIGIILMETSMHGSVILLLALLQNLALNVKEFGIMPYVLLIVEFFVE